MYHTLIEIPESASANEIHKIIHRVCSNSTDKDARCPRYVRLTPGMVQATSATEPAHPELAMTTYQAVPKTGAVRLVTDIAVVRKVNGRRKSFERGKESDAAKEIVRRQLAKYGISAPEITYKFAGIVRDPDHRVTLPHGIVTADITCTDVATLERICVEGWGDGRYLGLGAVRVVSR